jgi:hypothetical protein
MTEDEQVALAKKLASSLPKLPRSRIPRPKIKEGTGVPLKPGDKFALESEVQPGLFITWVGPGAQMFGEMGLRARVGNSMLASFSTFAFQKADKSDIKSGDFVKWMNDGKQIDWSKRQGVDYLDNKTWSDLANPKKTDMNCGKFGNICLIRQKRPRKADIQVMHAKELDYLNNVIDQPTWDWKSILDGMQGNAKDELTPDPREGEAIKDGDSVWIRHKAPLNDGHGPFYYLSGDPGEGYTVTFAHHYPGFDGYVEHINGGWLNVNDPHATSSRFTIRKVLTIREQLQTASVKGV